MYTMSADLVDEIYKNSDRMRLYTLLDDFYWEYYLGACPEDRFDTHGHAYCDICELSRVKFDKEFREKIEDTMRGLYNFNDHYETMQDVFPIFEIKKITVKIRNLRESLVDFSPPRKTKVINIVASPCAGKSTLACSLFSILKRMHLNVEYVSEFAKDLVWKGEIDLLNNQYYVAYRQYEILKSVYGKVDYIVCDSPLVVSLFYNYYNKDNVSDVLGTSRMILDKMEEFDNMYIFIKRRKELPYISVGRIHSEEESTNIEENLEYLLKCCDLKYITMDTCDSITDLVGNLLQQSDHS